MHHLAKFLGLIIFAWAGIADSAYAEKSMPACQNEIFRDARLVVCVAADNADVRLFLDDPGGEQFSGFSGVESFLRERDQKLAFAMNAGMFDDQRRPIGLYIEAGEEQKPINTNKGPGNFHLMPNGVFFVEKDGGDRRSGVLETQVFIEKREAKKIQFATQSGPMLVIDGEIHSRFLPDSNSRKRRNGVGVTQTGDVVFVLAKTPINFHDFALYFRDEAKTENALFLDGTISQLFAPDLKRNRSGFGLGPIVGVTLPNEFID